MTIARARIGDILVAQDSAAREVVESAAAAQERMRVGERQRIGEILVAQKNITSLQLARALSSQLAIPILEEPRLEHVNLDLFQRVPSAFARNHRILPFQDEGSFIHVLVADPLAFSPVDDLRVLLNAPVRVSVAPADALMDVLNKSYEKVALGADAIADELHDAAEDDGDEHFLEIEDIADSDDDAPIIRFVNALFSEALKERASDIHIEPFERELVVRFRIDGVLYEKVKPPKRQQARIVSRVKIMANLNIAEKRLPQDGRIRIKVAGRDVDIRVSTIPVAHGERVVMRLQDRSAGLLSLDDIGIGTSQLVGWRNLIHRPHGIILVTGPTGSGKTTSLYASISEINRPDLNILTVEDPIEYQIVGIGQVAVNPKIDLTFASGLRAFLRQDPDVILVGEIRDQETADIAIQASLTGHLVLSTLHTNDAAGAVTRLVDMGVESFLVGSSLIGIMAQRLVRRVCAHCAVSYQPSVNELAQIGATISDGGYLAPGMDRAASGPVFRSSEAGCDHCLGTGYRGRMGIYELLPVDERLRTLVTRNATVSEIKSAALQSGMITLRQDGARKVLTGITTIDEVLRVTQDDAGVEI